MGQPILSRPVVRKLRTLCLAFPGTSEASSWGHPNFRAGRRTFSTFEIVKGRPSIAFRLDAAEAEMLLRKKNFFATPYGKGCWVSVWVDGRVDWRLVERLLDRSYRTVATRRMMTELDRPQSRGAGGAGRSAAGRRQ